MEHGCVDQVAQALPPVGFKYGNHVHFPYDAFVQVPAPGACGADRLGTEGGEKEAFRMETGIINEFLAARFRRPIPPDVALHNSAPRGFIA